MDPAIVWIIKTSISLTRNELLTKRMKQFDFGRKTFAYLGTEATFKVNSCINIMCGVI